MSLAKHDMLENSEWQEEEMHDAVKTMEKEEQEKNDSGRDRET